MVKTTTSWEVRKGKGKRKESLLDPFVQSGSELTDKKSYQQADDGSPGNKGIGSSENESAFYDVEYQGGDNLKPQFFGLIEAFLDVPQNNGENLRIRKKKGVVEVRKERKNGGFLRVKQRVLTKATSTYMKPVIAKV